MIEPLRSSRVALSQLRPAISDVATHVIRQARVFEDPYAGTMHALIFWGVTTQLVGTALELMQMQLFVPFVELPFPRGAAYLAFETIMDLAGAAIIAGVAMAAWRRLVIRPPTLTTRSDDWYALLLLGLIPLAGFCLEGTRLLATTPEWAAWSPVGSLAAAAMRCAGVTAGAAEVLHPYLFLVHVALGVLLVATLPATKLRHVVSTPLHVVLRGRRRSGSLALIDQIEEAPTLGVGRVAEFTSRQLLSLDACVRCGRCEAVCPAAQSGMPYSPQALIQCLRECMVSELVSPNGRPACDLLGGALTEEAAWYCTTCGACTAVCPALLDPVDEVIDLRRYQVLTTGRVSKPVAEVLRNFERQGNPWGMLRDDRSSWARALGVRELEPGDETDVLLFTGCAAAYDERNKQVAASFVHLLQAAGVDFGILKGGEGCCGDAARRLGNEYLFQVFAEDNIERLGQVRFDRIVTLCPHCFNTLKNEYPDLGGEWTVEHHGVFLLAVLESLEEAARTGTRIGGRVAYHDSCYLARHNEVLEEPRQILDLAGVDRVEMARHGRDAFCCGGGGGQMWLESDPTIRINQCRLEHALEVDADIIATACPYCLLMLDDAVRARGLVDKVQVLDIAEVWHVRTASTARLPSTTVIQPEPAYSEVQP